LASEPEAFAINYLFEEIFSKYDDGSKEQDSAKYAACLSRFREAEDLCRDTNWRFRERSFLRYRVLTDPLSAGTIFNRAAQKINYVLGPFDEVAVREGCNFGPGATTRLPRIRSHRSYKFEGIPHATPLATLAISEILAEYPLWGVQLKDAGAPYEIVGGNKVVAVPKSYKTHRMIAIEPDWNLFIQKGIGAHIRKCLKRHAGQDLNDQGTNGFLAALGSITGELATIDLSMASDCVSYELVKYLLPPAWFEALEQCRSPQGTLDSGEVVNYQKFSSMGNGYTFELESLIFWALASTVVELLGLKDRRVFVYGDDIVVPTEAYSLVIDTLTLAGFVPNPKKSFSEGKFRESCGAHWYDGYDVTPIYIRERVDTLDRLFLLHNNTCRWLERMKPFMSIDQASEVDLFLEWIRSFAPESWRKPRLPRLDIGDGAFYGCFELSTPSKAPRGWYGWSIKTLQSRIVEDTKAPGAGLLLDALWKLEHQDDRVIPDKGVDLSSRASREAYLNGEHGFDGWMRIAGFTSVPRWKQTWRVSKQMVRGLAAGYCWWECLPTSGDTVVE
jgi:hypothetical protein